VLGLHLAARSPFTDLAMLVGSSSRSGAASVPLPNLRAPGVPRSRRLSILAVNPDPLFQECQQRIEDLRREAALSKELSGSTQRRLTDLRRHVRKELSFKPPQRQQSTPAEARIAVSPVDHVIRVLPPKPSSEVRCRKENVQDVASKEQGLKSSGNHPRRPCREGQPLTELHLQQVESEPVIARLVKQGAVNTLSAEPAGGVDFVARVSSEPQGLQCKPRTETCRSAREVESFSDCSDVEGPEGSLIVRAPGTSPHVDLMQFLTPSGFSPAAITSRIDRGCIDALFDSLARYQDADSCLIHAEMVGLLLVLVSWSRVRWPGDPPFRNMHDLLLDLRCSLITVRESLRWASAGVEPAPELHIRLCESCVCFTAHAEFKEMLLEAPETLQAMLSLVSAEELEKESHFAFLYASLIFNLCRSREDVFERDLLLSELREDSLIGHLYEDVLKSADAGSPELAEQLRSRCALRSPAVSLLTRCAESGSAGARDLASFNLRLVCKSPKHRGTVASGGGMHALLALLKHGTEAGQEAAQEALAQVCISVTPSAFPQGEQLQAVEPLLQLMQRGRERQQVDAAMGLTHLLTAGDELRSAAVQAGAWRLCQELLLCQSEALRRCVTEAMCNLTAQPAVRQLCATGGADREIEAFASFCLAHDRATQVAAAGALATIAMHPDVAVRISGGARWQRLVGLLDREDPDIQHRVAACLCHICHAERVAHDVRMQVWSALKDKCERLGFVSCEAEALARGTVQALGPTFESESCNGSVPNSCKPQKTSLAGSCRDKKGRSGSLSASRRLLSASRAGHGGA